MGAAVGEGISRGEGLRAWITGGEYIKGTPPPPTVGWSQDFDVWFLMSGHGRDPRCTRNTLFPAGGTVVQLCGCDSSFARILLLKTPSSSLVAPVTPCSKASLVADGFGYRPCQSLGLALLAALGAVHGVSWLV